MLPDTGERYLSTPLFDDIPVEMTEEEEQISRSTPLCRFDAPAAAPAPEMEEQQADAEAERFVSSALSDANNPVVMFALEWCEFCWSVRRLFAALSIPYRSIDLDSAAYQRDDLGGRIRAALRARLGTATIPQIFVGGAHVGGCSEMFDAARDGSLQKALRAAGVPFSASAQVAYDTLLPKWLKR
jgi:cysteine synthase A